MADPTGLDHLPQATVQRPKRARISIIWIIPLLAAAVAIGIAVQRIVREGPTVTIVFSAAEGVEAGKTLLKHKDVTIGRVTAVHLTSDYSKVEITAKITKRAAGLMVEDAKFWVVRPTISLSGVSGLNTLLSGNYIGFEPGKSEASQDSFTGLDVPPIAAGQQGRLFTITASDLGSLETGSPIYYRRVPVGQVTAYELTPDGKSVQIKVFVNAPYDKFVYSGTRFWNVSGVDVSLDADGINVRTESLVALLIGGLAFDVPPFVTKPEPAAANGVFALYTDRAAAMKAPDPVARHYVLHFTEPLRGLSVGAPVTLFGLPAGEVTDVGLAFDAKNARIRPRVLIAFYPDRILAYAKVKHEIPDAEATMRDGKKLRAFLRRQVEERGLRAQLKTGSLLTGQLYVALDYYPDAPKAKIDLAQETPEIPVVPSTLVQLEAKLGSILDKIDRMPLEAIGNELKKDLENLDQTLTSARKLISDVDTQLVPELKTGIEDMRRTLAAVERAMNNANATLLEPNAAIQEDLRNALSEFTRAARSLRVLADELERQPSSLVRGKTKPDGGEK